MSDPSETSPTPSAASQAGPIDDERVEHRADLLPEEQQAGSDDPQLEARVILEDSDARTADPEGTKHASMQTPNRHDQRDR